MKREKFIFIKNAIIFVLVTIVFANLFGGCNQMTSFTSEESAKEILLSGLEEKYNLKFRILGDEEFDEQANVYVYTCTAVPQDNSEQIFNARVTSFGEATDDYSLYYFYEPMVDFGRDACKRADFILSYKIKPQMNWTKQKWTNEDSFYTFIEESKAYDLLEVRMEDGLSDKKYAEQIRDFLDILSQSDISFDLRVTANDEQFFIYTVNNYDAGETSVTVEEIMEQMELDRLGKWDN